MIELEFGILGVFVNKIRAFKKKKKKGNILQKAIVSGDWASSQMDQFTDGLT